MWLSAGAWCSARQQRSQSGVQESERLYSSYERDTSNLQSQQRDSRVSEKTATDAGRTEQLALFGPKGLPAKQTRADTDIFGESPRLSPDQVTQEVFRGSESQSNNEQSGRTANEPGSSGRAGTQPRGTQGDGSTQTASSRQAASKDQASEINGFSLETQTEEDLATHQKADATRRRHMKQEKYPKVATKAFVQSRRYRELSKRRSQAFLEGLKKGIEEDQEFDRKYMNKAK